MKHTVCGSAVLFHFMPFQYSSVSLNTPLGDGRMDTWKAPTVRGTSMLSAGPPAINCARPFTSGIAECVMTVQGHPMSINSAGSSAADYLDRCGALAAAAAAGLSGMMLAVTSPSPALHAALSSCMCCILFKIYFTIWQLLLE